MTTTTWNSGTWNGNGSATITSPNTICPNANNSNTPGGPIFGDTAGPALPRGQKVYWEVTVNGGCSTAPQGIFTYTAFTLGIGVAPNSNFNNFSTLTSTGGTQANPSGPYTFCNFSYNKSVTIGNANGGYVVAAAPGAPANTLWSNGSIIGFAFDDIAHTLQFYLNGSPVWGAFNVAGFGSQSLFPLAQTWSGGHPTATINGGTGGFAEPVPSGFSALDGSGPSGGTGPVTIGSGPNTLALQVSEDAWNGNAQFTVSVDGRQIGGTQTATASHAAGQTQIFNVLGTFAAGSHTATVNFLNDAYGGTPATDRNLYVTGATIDNSVVSGATLTEGSAGPKSFSFTMPGSSGPGPSPPVTVGTGPDTLALQVSEDAWNGNAQFVVSVDGKLIGGTLTATASHAAGQTQIFNVLGTFAPGSHTAAVNFLNDAYGGSPATDRNLYVTGATIDNSVVSGATLSELVSGPQHFTFLAPGSSGSGSGSGSTDIVTVDQPAPLQSGLQTITGTESDPSQSIFLDWRTFGTPALGDSDWVQAKVGSSGAFSADVTIDHAGTTSTMYYRIGSGPTIAAWSGNPS